MAFATLANAPIDTQAPITLLYVRAADWDLSQLDAHLQAIVARYAPVVELQIVEPDNLPARFAERAVCAPAVLVLRRGEVVGEAIGALLPARELNRVVRCAVEWPDEAPA